MIALHKPRNIIVKASHYFLPVFFCWNHLVLKLGFFIISRQYIFSLFWKFIILTQQDYSLPLSLIHYFYLPISLTHYFSLPYSITYSLSLPLSLIHSPFLTLFLSLNLVPSFYLRLTHLHSPFSISYSFSLSLILNLPLSLSLLSLFLPPSLPHPLSLSLTLGVSFVVADYFVDIFSHLRWQLEAKKKPPLFAFYIIFLNNICLC